MAQRPVYKTKLDQEFYSALTQAYLSQTTQTVVALQQLYKSQGDDNFSLPSYESAPNTTIQNRARVNRSLKAVAGIERVMVRSINLLQKESGPNGERVWESDNKDSRIRFVGNGWNQLSNTYGAYIQSTTLNDFIEVTFYGTGLNVLVCAAATALDVRVSVNGGAEGSDIFPSIISTITGGRNYAPNIVVPAVSNLNLGFYTVKLRIASTALEFVPNGFEIINQRSDVAVYPGSCISNGTLTNLASLSTSAFNAGVVGTRGSRAIKYIESSVLKSANIEVDSTAKYLANADHTNEEIARRINFREFGVSRADDFSTMTTGLDSNAYTLDDGSTTLVCSNGNTASSSTGIWPGTSAAFFTFTFIGTGIDFIRSDTAGATIDSHTVIVDGVNVGSLTGTASTSERVQKIASGLPYGTHTVRILRPSAVNAAIGASDFIIYHPKKPSISQGSFEVADYNLVGNYSYSNISSVEVSSGVIRKACTREVTYIGTWSATLDVAFANSGFFISTSTIGSSLRYTFWGTGVEWFFKTNASLAMSINIAVDGSSNFTIANGSPVGGAGWTSALTTQYLPASTGTTFTASTGNLTGTSAGQGEAKILLNGLTLGLHTIVITQNAATNTLLHDSFDIITPIHINDQSLKIGNRSIKSITDRSIENVLGNSEPELSKAKAWVTFDPSTNKIISSYNVSAILQTAAGTTLVTFEKPFKDTTYVVNSTSGTGSHTGGYFNPNKKPNSCEVSVWRSDTGFQSNVISAVFFGQLIDE